VEETVSVWQGTGEVFNTPPTLHRIPEYDPKLRQHFWIIPVAYAVDPRSWKEGDSPMLNANNICSIPGAGCYYCERVYTHVEGLKSCRGEPKS
jgi:hypothetical protein